MPTDDTKAALADLADRLARVEGKLDALLSMMQKSSGPSEHPSQPHDVVKSYLAKLRCKGLEEPQWNTYSKAAQALASDHFLSDRLSRLWELRASTQDWHRPRDLDERFVAAFVVWITTRFFDEEDEQPSEGGKLAKK